MTAPTTWTLVSNGVQARILCSLDDGAKTAGSAREAPGELLLKTEAANLRDHLSDRSGAGFAPGAASPAATCAAPIRRDIEDFARELTAFLDDAQRSGAFEQLALVAAPTMFAVLRETMPPGLRARVVAERRANLLWLSTPQLRAAVRAMLSETPAKTPR